MEAKKNRTVMIAIPSHERSCDIYLAAELVRSVTDLWLEGWGMVNHYAIGDPFIGRARNTLLAEFVRGGYDKLLFIDDDVVPEQGAIKRILSYDEGIVGGIYRARQDEEVYKVNMKPGVVKLDPRSLLEVDDLPMGFTCISREVATAMIAQYKDRQYQEPGKPESWDLFTQGFCFDDRGDGLGKRGGFRGEDFWFCLRAREMGIKIWLDPWIKFEHVGKKSFMGCFGTYHMSHAIKQDEAIDVEKIEQKPTADRNLGIRGGPVASVENVAKGRQRKAELLNGARIPV